ncbi:MAG TPA: glycoside hydrolase family 27 protein [Bryobacteraceae bacterium]|nr:glycoside hydrolase family 27 protein [Bryobacteraceae bacterium]
MKWLTFCAAALACLAAAHAQSLTGRWAGNGSTTDNGMEIVVALNQGADGRITGYVLGRSQDTITDGKIEDGKITLEAERPGRNGDTQKVTYTAVIEDGKLKLTMPMFGGGRGPGRGPAGTPGAAPGTPPAAAAAPGRSPGGGRGPQVFELARVSTEVPKPLPPKPAAVSLSFPAPVKSNGLAKTPPMGWNSWNKFSNRVSDQMVREMADAFVKSGMRDAGYIYVNIDDTWEGAHRDAHGNITTNNKFPDMKALADYVHSKGLKLGIYSSPGPKTCAGYEGSYQHEEQDAKTYASWGIDYLKYDWCSASQVYDNTQATMAAAYAKMGEALEHSGRNIVYSLCQYGNLDVGEWGARVSGNLWRTTGDIRDTWASMSHIGFDLQPGREKYAGTGHWNDPDMLEIGNGGMTEIEYQTHMSLWSLLAAPLLAGNDLRDMKPEVAAILMNKEVIAIDQDSPGKQGVRVAKDGDQEVWAKPLADGGYAVGLFNRGDAASKITAKWSDIGVTGTRKLRDLWKHQDLGSMSDSFSAEVPSHGVALVKIAK